MNASEQSECRHANRAAITDISTSSDFAIGWVNRYSGNAYQLSNQKGTSTVTLAHRLGGERLWKFTELTVQEFIANPPSSFAEFVSIAEIYVQ